MNQTGMKSRNNDSHYISALRSDWLTSFYDPIMQFALREKKFKRALIDHARIDSGHRVLDLGCGSATLTILLKQMHPDAKIVGLDGDAKILEIASRKIALVI
jgi:ubiquinone/menaquinone biosynthesis C-methylase UbiE